MDLLASRRLLSSSLLVDMPHGQLKPRDTTRLFGRNWHDNLPSHDRRELRRMRVSWPSTIIDEVETYAAIVADISLTGARAKTVAKLSPDRPVLLDIHSIAKLTVRPIWESNGEMGLQFLASTSLVLEKLPSHCADLL